MATPQGNFSAYIPLKPAELKVGEIYAKWAEGYIKRGDAEKAAKLKQAQEQSKSLLDTLKDIKIDHKQTISPFQNSYNKIVSEGIEKIGQAQQIINSPDIPMEQKYQAKQYVLNYTNSVKELGTFLADPNFIKRYNENKELITSKKGFQGDPLVGLMTSAETGAWDIKIDENGVAQVAYVNNINDTPDKPLTYEPLSVVKQRFMGQVREDTYDAFVKQLLEQGQKVTTEIINSDGYVKTTEKKFDRDRGKKELYAWFGYDSNKTNDELYNANDVPIKINDLFYNHNQRNIETKEDFSEALDTALKVMEYGSDYKKGKEVLQTPEDIAIKKLRIANGKEDLLKKQYNRARGYNGNDNREGGSGEYMLSSGLSMVQIRDKNGEIKGVQNWDIASVALPKLKGMPETPHSFGYTTFKNKKGDIVKYWLIGSQGEDGRIVYTPTAPKDIAELVAKAGYSPNMIMSGLEKNAPPYNRYSSQIGTHINTNTRIGSKNKYTKEPKKNYLDLINNGDIKINNQKK